MPTDTKALIEANEANLRVAQLRPEREKHVNVVHEPNAIVSRNRKFDSLSSYVHKTE